MSKGIANCYHRMTVTIDPRKVLGTSKNTVIRDGVIGRGGMLSTLDIHVHPFDNGYKFCPTARFVSIYIGRKSKNMGIDTKVSNFSIRSLPVRAYLTDSSE